LYSVKFLSSAILLILLGKSLIAQQYYFNRRYDFNQSSVEEGGIVISTDSGSLVLIGTTASGGNIKRCLLFLDESGNIQTYKLDSLPNSDIYVSRGTNLIKLPNNKLLNGCGVNFSGNAQAALTVFDSIQNVEWMQVYGDDSFQTGWMSRHTRDNGFILTGQTSTFDFYGDAMLIKTDSLGAFLWEKHYGGVGEDITFAMDTCFDGGYILAGYTKSFGIGTPSLRCGNCYAIKTDSLGNLKWYKTFGDIYGEPFYCCLQSNDSSYVFAGHWVNTDPYYPNCNVGAVRSTPYIVKLDTAGSVIWAKTYGAIGSDITIFSIKELDNGDLVAAGIYDHLGLPNDGFRGLIIRVNSVGDSLWYLTYNPGVSNLTDGFLYDICQSNDGGFIATGQAYPKPPDTGNQDVWVLKVDSNGCEVANCVLSSSGELISYSNGLTLYPNPSTGVFNISHNYYEIETTEVYNCIGEKVFSREGSSEQIDLSKASLGVYFYCIKTRQGKFFKGRIVKE
jgi:hypothetical protein